MKVLITGSSGSLGRLLIDYLISANIAVIGIDIRENEDHLNEKQIRFYKCCITDKDKLQAIFDAEQPTNVIHLACSFNKIRDRQREHMIDIGGSINILEVSNNSKSVCQLIFSSSVASYGAHIDNNAWLNESDQLRPGKYRYGCNKKLIEETYFKTPVRSDLRITSLRICQVVGPTFDKPRSIVSLMIKSPFLPKVSRENKLQFIHSDDLVSLVGLIIEDRGISGIFNLAPDTFSLVEELVPGKRFRNIPLYFITAILHILWNLKILNLQPAAVKTSIYPMILDPSKIISRYGYKFKFTSNEAFMITANNTKITANSKF